ncbi:MAG: hypothetical protein EZS28_030732 [Streblomastix strix]|uniref:Uncharacterized protein n=1 Tax=Streblomastix strix TaxID=222440 RepID=A0A5J4UV76_9EUKA|nr:MAG: hypothetical protein EZS28_030732 [Streblomastix strix]
MSVDFNSQSSSLQHKPPHHDIPVLIPEICQPQKGVLLQTQKLQISKFPRNFRDVLNDDADNYTQLDEEYIDFKSCDFNVDDRRGEVMVGFSGEVKAVVKENVLFAADTGEMLQCGFFEFEHDEELSLWSLCILADATELKQAQLQSLTQPQSQNLIFWSQKQPFKGTEPQNNMISAKHMRERSFLLQGWSQNPFQMLFQQQKQQYSKFNSLQDQNVEQNLFSSFQDVQKKDASKVDMTNYTLELIVRNERNKL